MKEQGKKHIEKLRREGRITAKGYDLFSTETEEMNKGNKERKVLRFPFVELKH